MTDMSPCKWTVLTFSEVADCLGGISPTSTTDEYFRNQDGNANQQGTPQIDNDECATTIFASDVGKPPDVSQADGEAGGGHQEAEG